MVLYLAGLKSVDPSLREAAAIDGANERQTFFRVVLPVLRPINVVILVITVIESLRAFDIVYVINKGLNGLELLSVLVTQNIVGESSRVGFGSAIAVVLLVISVGPIIVFLTRTLRGADMTARRRAELRRPARGRHAAGRRASGRAASLLHAFLIGISLLWLFPLLWAVYTSLRPYGETAEHGYVSIADGLTPRQLRQRLGQAPIPMFFLNTLIILVPAVIIVLLLASTIAFAVSRFSFRFNLAPADAVHGRQPAARRRSSSRRCTGCTWPCRCRRSLSDERRLVRPVLRDHRDPHRVPARLLHVRAEQLHEDAAQGADRGRAGRRRVGVAHVLAGHPAAVQAAAGRARDARVHVHLQRLLLGPGADVTGDKRPITSALNNLQGQFFSDNNLLAAGAIIIALPTLIVYFVLQTPVHRAG